MSQVYKIDYVCMTLLTQDDRKLKNVIPEELFPELEGSLIGGGRCFTPFPNTED